MSLKETIKYITALACLPFIGSRRKVVLCYHSLKAEAVVNFRRQMEYLVGRFEVVKPSEILSAEPRNKTMVAVTFDDAFTSFYENAVPVLKEFDISVGIFVPTGFIGQQCNWQMPQGHPDRQETVVDCSRLIELEKDGFEVFSHTVTHPKLTTLSEENLKKELIESKAALEKILAHSVNTISYPHGAHDKKVTNAAKESGYELGFTIEPQCVSEATNPFGIGRFVVSPNEKLSTFKLKACGAYVAESILRNLKRRIK